MNPPLRLAIELGEGGAQHLVMLAQGVKGALQGIFMESTAEPQR